MPRNFLLRAVPGALLTALALFAAQPASAAETLTMTTTGRGSAQQWPIFAAIHKGFFAAHNVKMDLVSAPSSAAVQQQLASGSVGLGSGGLADPLRAIDKGAKVSLLRIETQVPPYNIAAKPEIKTVADLKGKTIIIGGIKDITRIYLERMLTPNGVKPGEYDLVFAGTTSARFAALSSGGVDAAILVPPFSFKADSAGYTNVIQSAEYTRDLPFTGYAVNTEWAKKNKGLLLNFLNGVAQGIDWFNDPANREEAIAILIKESRTTRADVEPTYDFYRKINIFERRGIIEGSTIGNLIKALKDLGDIEGSTDIARFIDPEIGQLAHQVK